MAVETYESIFQFFPPSSAEDWKNKIIKDLKGEPFDKLIWHTNENIDVLPFYTKESTNGMQLQIPAKTKKGWKIAERIAVLEYGTANKSALLSLHAGVQIIIFDLQNKNITTTEISILVNEIDTEIAPVFFENYKAEDKITLENIVKDSCTVFAKIPQENTLTEELVYLLNLAKKTSNETAHVHFFVGQNYFFEIAKLRAARWLWQQMADLKNQHSQLYISTETSTTSFSTEDVNYNMLRNTTAAMSAIIGGCDQLLINSHDCEVAETSLGKRIARNVQHILNYESYFEELQDTAKGSYYIEYLTYQLAKNAWTQFVDINNH